MIHPELKDRESVYYYVAHCTDEDEMYREKFLRIEQAQIYFADCLLCGLGDEDLEGESIELGKCDHNGDNERLISHRFYPPDDEESLANSGVKLRNYG
ncbi:hypothetical protein OAK65_03735 [Synechococcus sp. AH-551-N17]|nr:hypothetical protein [Synechococcus sp. AH-551-N17]